MTTRMVPAMVPDNALVLNREEWAALRKWLGDYDDGWLARLQTASCGLAAAWGDLEARLPKGWHIELVGAHGVYVASAGPDLKPLEIHRTERTPDVALRSLMGKLRDGI